MEVQLNTKLFTDTHEVRPGVVIGISTNQKKPTWYLVKLNDRWIQTSLGTTDFYKATDEAVRRIGNFEESVDLNALRYIRANRHAFEKRYFENYQMSNKSGACQTFALKRRTTM